MDLRQYLWIAGRPDLQEPLTGMFPDKGMLVLGSIKFHALLH